MSTSVGKRGRKSGTSKEEPVEKKPLITKNQEPEDIKPIIKIIRINLVPTVHQRPITTTATIISNRGDGGESATGISSAANLHDGETSEPSGVTNQEETVEKKPFITINVKTNQDQSVVTFRIKRSSQLARVMKAYCENKAVSFNTYRFLFNGRRVRSFQTADELDMEDEDEIDAFLLQEGGCFN